MRLLASLCALLLAAACGSVNATPDAGIDADPSTPIDATVPDASIEELCSGASIPLDILEECLLRAVCYAQPRCNSTQFSENECLQNRLYQGSIQLSLGKAVVESVEAGNAAYDPIAMGSFLAGLRNCAADQGLFENAVVGTIGDGLACFYDEECATNGGCVGANFSDGTCNAGVCEASVSVGTECDLSAKANCNAGLHCVNGFCRTGEVGAPCTYSGNCDAGNWCSQTNQCEAQVSVGDDCVNDDQCPGASTCVGESEGGGKCQTVDTVGDACDTDCVGLLYCEGYSPGVSTGTCQEKPGLGGNCTTTGGCNSATLWCDTTCKLRPTLGNTCADNTTIEYLRYCAPGLVCSGNTCSTPLANGDICTNAIECESFTCNGNPGQCVARAQCL
jgi:hypothetical protein